jgi:citrate synthase
MDSSIEERYHWQTAVSHADAHVPTIRGYPHAEIIEKLSFSQAAFLTIRGRIPNANETRMIDALLCSILDLQFVSSAVPAARYVASGNPQVVPAIAAGILSAGSNALSPEPSANLLLEAMTLKEREGLSVEDAAQRVVQERRARKERIPGLGHPLFRQLDPRAESLYKVAQEAGFDRGFVRMARAIHAGFQASTGKKLCLNLELMAAAIMMELGFAPREAIAVNLLSYLPGIIAHVVEEIESGVPLRTIPEALAEYTGEPLRHIED